jgi:hypothetical protein
LDTTECKSQLMLIEIEEKHRWVQKRQDLDLSFLTK